MANGGEAREAYAERVRVLVVDDSAVIRRMLAETLSEDPEIHVVGTAPDALIAQRKILRLDPHVITLDVEMPGVDGLRFLQELMRVRPMPVVMVSSATGRGADATIRALELGAVDCIEKPMAADGSPKGFDARLAGIVKRAAAVPIGVGRAVRPPPADGESLRSDLGVILDPPRTSGVATQPVIAIGASTGGTEALARILESLSPDVPGIVVAQHLGEPFVAALARRLDECSRLRVVQAAHGERIRRGWAYIAPGDRHLLVGRRGTELHCELRDGPPVNHHRPSVDVLFRSVASAAGPRAVGVILTGMGSDGARGLLEMRRAGAHTIAQDEASSVVWGMPRSAVELGAADRVLGLAEIAPRLFAAGRSLPAASGGDASRG